MLKIIVLLVTCLFFVACGGGSSGSAPSSPPAKPDPISETPQGVFTIESEREGVESDFSLFTKCSSDDGQLDTRIKAGTSLLMNTASFTQKNYYKESVNLTIKTVNRNEKNFVLQALYLDGPRESAGTIDETTWPAPPSNLAQHKGLFKDLPDDKASCSTGKLEKSEFFKIASGRFQFANTDLSLAAKRFYLKAKTNLTCDGQNVGLGSVKIIFITTRDIPNFFPVNLNCNESALFGYGQYVDSSGVVKHSGSFEILSYQESKSVAKQATPLRSKQKPKSSKNQSLKAP